MMRSRRFWLVAIALTSLLAVLLMAGCGEAEAPPATPKPTSTGGPPTAGTPEAAITIDSPAVGETVTVPISVRGTASVFEGTLTVALKDSQGNDLCQVIVQASEGAPGRGDYSADIAFPPPLAPMNGRIEAYGANPKDGSVEDLVSIPVTISEELPPIVVTSPRCNQEVRSPLLVEGTASVFEGALIIVVKDWQGKELARVSAQALEAGPERGDFAQEVTFPVTDRPQRGTVEAFSEDASDGSVINLFSVPVILTP